MIDLNTIQRCRAGNENAYRQVYNTCAPYIYTIVKNYFCHVDDRKDALQEIFAQIFLSMKNFDQDKGSFKGWISKIAVYQCIGLLKNKNKFSFIASSISNEHHEEPISMNWMDELSQDEIENILLDMPLGYKAVFLLSVIDEYSHKEIGEMLGITPETSRSQLSRAIKWIKSNVLTEKNQIAYGIF